MTKVSRVKSFKELTPKLSFCCFFIYRKWQKFWEREVSRFAGFIRYAEKSFAIFSITTFMHSCFFQLYKTATSVSTKASCSSREFSLKLVISILGNGREYITDTCVCRFHAFQDGRPCSQEKSYRWSESEIKQIANRFLAASYFLISWQKPFTFFTTTVEYFFQDLISSNISKFFMVSTFSGAKV